MHCMLVKVRGVSSADVITADPPDMGIATDATGTNSATKSSDMRATAETADMRTTTKSAHMAAATKSATMPAATTATATRVGGNGQKARSKKGRRQDHYHSFHQIAPQVVWESGAQPSQSHRTEAVLDER
jgi:hypothetical protein